MKYLAIFIILIVIVFGALGFLSIQAKGQINNLTHQVNTLEKITAPPKVDVLSQNMTFNGTSISVSKLVIEQLGLNTFIRADITNKTNQPEIYSIGLRKASYTEDGYVALDSDSPYVVAPLSDALSIDSGDKKTLMVLVSKSDASSYKNTEAWVSIMPTTTSRFQNEVVLRILIKGDSG